MKCPIACVSVQTVESRPTARVGQILSTRRALARPEDQPHAAQGAGLHCETSGRGSVNNLRRVQLLSQIETNRCAVGLGQQAGGLFSHHYRLGPQGRVLGAT